MGGISFLEIAMVFIVAVLVFGPNRLPEMARGLGKAMQEYRQAAARVQSELNWDVTHPARAERLDEGAPPTAAAPTLDPDSHQGESNR